MPAPVSTAPSIAPTASPPSPSLGSVGFGILGTGTSLFGNILSLGKAVPSTPDIQTNLTLTGNSGFSLDPAMLVLPQELSVLSSEDLQAFMAQFAGNEDGSLNNQILQSLTPGIPTKELLKNENGKKDCGCVLSLNPEFSNMPTPVNEDNILLAASGLTPITMEEFKNTLQKIADDVAIADDAAIKDSIEMDSVDLTPDTMVMVMYLSTQPTPVAQNVTDFEFDPSVFSSLTKIMQPPSNNTNLFSGEIDFTGETITPLSLNKSEGSSIGFQGSLASLEKNSGTDKSIKSIGGDVNGQLSMSGSGLTHLCGTPIAHLSESSLLMANGNLIGINNLSPNTNPLFTSASAIGTHPSTQLIAMMIEKAATGSDKAKQELSVQLDPPELGRMQIHLSMEKGEAMKVHLIAEKQETLTLLQRDSHALKSALENAGIRTDESSLSFDLSSGNQSFNQLLGGSQQDNQSGRNTYFALNADGSIIHEDQMNFIETKMNFIPDKITGNVHYSLLV